ncbi:MAG: hypothetical protein U0V56_11000 [Actinomycetota bacterium]
MGSVPRLVLDGVSRAHARGPRASSTETERNVALYERLGFRVLERAEAGERPDDLVQRARTPQR